MGFIWRCDKNAFKTKPLIEYMRMVPDPRSDRKKKHDMGEMLVCLVAGYISGHTGLRRCVSWCSRHESELRKGLKLKNGIASVATVSRLLSSIDEELFLYAFMEWAGEIINTSGKHLAIDGKALCASASKVTGSRVPMLLNAVETMTGIVVAQLPLVSKENEIIMIPKLLQLLNLKNSIVTTDAIGTQTAIMKQIVDQGGHFVMLVKKNQPQSYDEIMQHFKELESDTARSRVLQLKQEDYDEYICKEKNRDRYEYRECRVCYDPKCLSKTFKEWPFIKTVGCMSQTRILMVRDGYGNDITPDAKRFAEKGTFRQTRPSQGDGEQDAIQMVGVISDMKLSAEETGKCRRDHWSVENRLHHILDDTFREDRSPARESKNNLALIRKFALNLIRIACVMEKASKPVTEMMDMFSDDSSLLGRYLFNGIASIG